jgi:histone-lysine N-methyltransferase SUV420H
MYVKIYMLDCPFEISSTNRYTSKLYEATVTAWEPIKMGAAIKYLCGT